MTQTCALDERLDQPYREAWQPAHDFTSSPFITTAIPSRAVAGDVRATDGAKLLAYDTRRPVKTSRAFFLCVTAPDPHLSNSP